MEQSPQPEQVSQSICNDLLKLQQSGSSKVRAALEISECVNNCPHCYAKPLFPLGNMSVANAEVCLTGIQAAGYKEVYIPGGEPMLNPGVEKICQRAQQLGLYTILVTNGFKLNQIDPATRMLQAVDRVEISVRSRSGNVHDNIVLGNGWVEDNIAKKPAVGGFDAAIEAFKMLTKMKKQHNLKTSFAINHDLYENNAILNGHGMVYQLVQWMVQSKEIDLDGINLQLIRMEGRAKENASLINQIQITPDGLIQALYDLDQIRNDFHIEGSLIDDPVATNIIPSIDVIPEEIRRYITPEMVPSISMDGTVRANVIETS